MVGATVPIGRSPTRRYRGSVKRQEKADRIAAILDELYPQPPVPLDHVDPYTLLVAVALSAQTTDKKVNQVTPALFAEADTPERMVALGPERILELIREVGLAPTKARNLWTAANQIVEAGGEVLPDWEFLESLAGVGHKTASVVMAQAFGVPAFPVDTHIHRLAARWGLSDGSTVERTEGDLKRVFPKHTWNDRHLQIIFFGREHCPALRHDPAGCPICSWAGLKRSRSVAQRRNGRQAPRYSSPDS
jgi:endonuclease-3